MHILYNKKERISYLNVKMQKRIVVDGFSEQRNGKVISVWKRSSEIAHEMDVAEKKSGK